jgi:lipopolysaccharide export system permease protein
MKFTSLKPLPESRSRWVQVIDRTIAGELARTMLTVLLVLVTIIVSRKFLSILSKAIEGQIAGDTLFKLLGLKMLAASITLLPPSLFLAVLLVFGRMYRDQEMSGWSSAGVGLSRLYRAIAVFVVPLFFLNALLAFQVMPWAEKNAQSLMEKDSQTSDVRSIKPGRFNEFSKGDVVLYAESLSDDDQTMSKLFVQSRSGEQFGVVIAESGYLQENNLGEHFVVMQRGRRYQGTPGQADFVISDFDDYAVRIDEGSSESEELHREGKATIELLVSSSPREWAELQRRVAVPAGTLLLSLLAVPLARVAPRGGVYGSVFNAFLIFVVYENLQRISQGLMTQGKLPLWFCFAGVYSIVLMIIAFYIVKLYGIRWVWVQLQEKMSGNKAKAHLG